MNVERLYLRLAVAMVAVIVSALALVASNASAVIVQLPNGHKLGITPQKHVSSASVASSSASPAASSSWNGTLNYNGGPVVHSSMPYLVFWTPSGQSIPLASQSLLERWLTDTSADSGKSSDAFGVLRQYTDSSGFTDYKQSFNPSSQVITDTQPYPVRDTTNCPDIASSYPTCVTDAQIDTELQRLTQANGLPSDGNPKTLTSNAPIYIVVLPNDVNVCFPIGGGTRCGDNYFCSYHGNFATSSNQELLYTVDLTLSDYLHPKQCQTDGISPVQEPNGNVADLTIGLLIHEYAEALTDPEYNAWNFDSNEVGDACVNYAATANPEQRQTPYAYAPTLGGNGSARTPLYDQSINGNHYYTQSLWSNGDLNCHLKPAAGTISPSFTDTAPVTAGTAVSFDPSAGTSTNGYTSVTWNWGDGTSTFSTASPTTVQHTYSATGTYNVSLTLVDTAGNIATSTKTVSIGSPPVVSTGGSSTVGTTSATVAGTVNPNGLATTYQFDYGTSPSYGSQAPAPPDPSAGSGTAAQNESANLTNLSPGTTYHYRIEATNSSGTTYGSDQTFTTGPVNAVLSGIFLDGGGTPPALLTLTAGPALAHAKITKAKISSKKRSASFSFKAKGTVKRFQCALVLAPPKGHHRKKPSYAACKPGKTYMHLKAGKYTFFVRGVNVSGPGSPAEKKFAIG